MHVLRLPAEEASGMVAQAQLETEQAAMTHDELLDAIFRSFDKLDEIARRPSR